MDSRELAAKIYIDLCNIVERIRRIRSVIDTYFIIIGENPPSSEEFKGVLDWEDVEKACAGNGHMQTRIGIKRSSGDVYTFVAVFYWSNHSNALFSKYPENSNIRQFQCFEVVHGYTFILYNKDEKTVLVIDSQPHHKEISETFPHHRHEKIPRHGISKRREIGPFYANLDDLQRYLEGYL